MLIGQRGLWTMILSILLPMAWVGVSTSAETKAAAQSSDFIERDYSDTTRHLLRYRGIKVQGSPLHVKQITKWLDLIRTVPHGRETVDAILASGNLLTIRSSQWALHASGRTLAPVTDDLINGRGADVEILFDARIPDRGSHQVYGDANRLIEFTAVQNLYHELAHAKHLTNGTWRYNNSEAQAIEEENVFRRQLSQIQGRTTVAYRTSVKGVQFWWPKD